MTKLTEVHSETGSSYAISNVQCQYDNDLVDSTMAVGPDGSRIRQAAFRMDDHNYNRDEPPAFFIQNVANDPTPTEFSFSKRVRRSEAVLRAAADCVSKGLTFQTASEQFNIPISTIRFYMARKGILPRRRRGRTTAIDRPEPYRPEYTSPEPPYHMQHYRLPDMIALHDDEDSPPPT